MASSSTKDTSRMNLRDYLVSIGIPSKELESATNNYADENILARGSYANLYKGQLSQSGELVNIVVRRCLQLNDSILVNEVTMYKNLTHKNIISLFKFVNLDKKEACTIHKHEANGSLDNHLGGSTLTWMQRLQICVGVAQGLRYLHFGLKDDYSVIHGNIKSSKVLLDHNWEPKLHDFRCAMKVKRHNMYLTNNYLGTLQYMDPAFESTEGLTHKSDVFSFGVVLFEVLFGMKASIEEGDNWYFAKMARLCYEEKTFDDKIDRDLQKQMDIQSLNLFSETAYLCLNEERAKRPDMEQIVRKLERALELHQSHIHPTAAVVTCASSNGLKGGHMDHLKVPLSEIKSATDKFSERYLIGLGGYGMVYIAPLKCFDGTRTVAIKRIVAKGAGQAKQGFIAEIEMLGRCKHTNIISLLGFCDEDDELIIICEYAAKGSLDNYLGNVDNTTNFTWAQRIKICLDIANGLHYLHTSIHEKNTVIHRDIKSANILLDDKWVAKIADFGLSKLQHTNQNVSTLVTNHVAGTPWYLDPVYEKEGKLKKKSDIYSFGVVLFEIMCGKLAYDQAFDGKGLAAIARHCYKDGTLKKLVDPKIQEADESIFTLSRGVNQVSLEIFLEIAYKCVSESQNERPTIEAVIKELEEALYYQENNKDSLSISLEEIKLGTENFNDCKCIGEGRYWKQYVGEITQANKRITVVAKRWDSKVHQSRHQFFTELEILYEHKHENIISVVGYCNEMGEKIIVYEKTSNGSLDKHLNNASLTWMKRLKICIDVARGLNFLHTQVSMIHRDIKSASILLDDDWKAKISNLELSIELLDMQRIEHITDDNAYGSLSYVSKDDKEQDYLTSESDIYSLGVVLKQILWGRLTDPADRATNNKLKNGQEILHHLEFEGLKEQIDPESKAAFVDIAGLCLAYRKYRPRAAEVIRKLEKALKVQITNTQKIYDSTEMKEDLYNMFSKGTLLNDDKVWLSLGNNGERNEMISARSFSYKNRRSRKWRSVQGSRFSKVADISDISNLKIQIKIKTQFISPCVEHKVHLIFRACGPRKSQAKRMYVDLKYKRGNETLHAYFATWREDGWMMIELFKSLEDTDFEVQLESFSQCYSEISSIHIEGIEFQTIDKVNHEAIERLKEVQKVLKENSNTDKEEKQEMMLSPKEAVFTPSELRIPQRIDKTMIRIQRVYSESSRFSGAIEFERQQVFRIKCKIERRMLSENKKIVCYLVFKLSEKCCGLHGPVLVRNLFRRKETRILYFRSPYPRNLHDRDWIPEKRKDGWMEVIFWIFNSPYEHEKNGLFVNLKLVAYEGTMSGIILRGIEFRSI